MAQKLKDFFRIPAEVFFHDASSIFRHLHVPFTAARRLYSEVTFSPIPAEIEQLIPVAAYTSSLWP